MSEFTVNRDEAIRAIEVLGLVPSRPGIATSEVICISGKKNAIRLFMTSEVSGYVDIKGSGRWPFEKNIYIDRRLFDPFICAARSIKSKSDFKFSKNGKELIITNGSRKAKLECKTTQQGYDEIKKSGSREVKAEKTLNKLLLAAKECAETETAVPELNCVYAIKKKNLILYSTTGKAVFRAEVKSKLRMKKPLPFPLFVIDLFANEHLKGIEATDKEVVLDFGCGKVWQKVAVKADKKFPYKKIDEQLSKERKNSKLGFVVDSKSFADVVSRLSSYLGSVRRLDWVLNLKGEKGSNKLELTIPLGNTIFRDKVKIEGKVNYNFSVDWPLDRLSGIIAVMGSIKEKLFVSFDKENRAYIKNGNIKLLVSRRTN